MTLVVLDECIRKVESNLVFWRGGVNEKHERMIQVSKCSIFISAFYCFICVPRRSEKKGSFKTKQTKQTLAEFYSSDTNRMCAARRRLRSPPPFVLLKCTFGARLRKIPSFSLFFVRACVCGKKIQIPIINCGANACAAQNTFSLSSPWSHERAPQMIQSSAAAMPRPPPPPTQQTSSCSDC